MARILIGNIKGPQGNDGAPGAVGPEGPPGPQGQPGEVDANTKITFEEATQRTNVESGDTIRTIFGKVKKWFTDLKPHAFADPVNNLTGTDASLPLAAPQGKALDDKITQLNSALANTMQLRGDLNSASAIKDLKIGIYNVKSSVPEWLSFGWAMVYIPSEGVLNGAYAVSYASGTDAGMYYYSVRTSSWEKV